MALITLPYTQRLIYQRWLRWYQAQGIETTYVHRTHAYFQSREGYGPPGV